MRLVLIIFIIVTNYSFAQTKESVEDKFISELRLKYYAAVEHSDSVEVFNQYLALIDSLDIPHHTDLLQAYKGALVAVKAKHAFWPFTKLSYLEDSMNILEKSIDNSPDNLEIRFLRFSILHYVPDFLGWNEEKKNDGNKIVRLLLANKTGGIPEDLLAGITRFMIESERLDKSDVAELNKQVLLTLEQ